MFVVVCTKVSSAVSPEWNQLVNIEWCKQELWAITLSWSRGKTRGGSGVWGDCCLQPTLDSTTLTTHPLQCTRWDRHCMWLSLRNQGGYFSNLYVQKKRNLNLIDPSSHTVNCNVWIMSAQWLQHKKCYYFERTQFMFYMFSTSTSSASYVLYVPLLQ